MRPQRGSTEVGEGSLATGCPSSFLVAMPLALVHPLRCLTKLPLQPGEAQRLYSPPQRQGEAMRPLIGYWLACPACRCPGVWLAGEGAPLEEGPVVELLGVRHAGKPVERFYGPAWIATTRVQVCRGCRRALRLDRERGVEVVPAEATA